MPLPDPSMRPLRVTAHLQAGVVHSHSWGIALDGLLASQVHERAKDAALSAGEPIVPVMERDVVEDLELPLARCGTNNCDPIDEDWHWAATCAWPEPAGAAGLELAGPADVDEGRDGEDYEVRTWYSFPDHDILERLVTTLPQHVDDERGRWRRYAMPQLVTMAPALTWRAVGDVDAVHALLEPIRAIGKSRARGEGTVLRWDVTPEPDADPWDAGHLHPDGSLGRPVPASCLTGRDAVRHDAVAWTGLRPPYLHPARRRRLHRPLPWHLEQEPEGL